MMVNQKSGKTWISWIELVQRDFTNIYTHINLLRTAAMLMRATNKFILKNDDKLICNIKVKGNNSKIKIKPFRQNKFLWILFIYKVRYRSKLKKHLTYAFLSYHYNNHITIIAISISQINSEFNNKEKMVIHMDGWFRKTSSWFYSNKRRLV